ncbi:MAG: hypothetical protein B7X31_10060 [Thiomonas sp. 13-66-29]|jgi:hypothetical protein|nr:MAG: hypothetical protein B7X31_10060 [Thiomonas sp. 13-66-29]
MNNVTLRIELLGYWHPGAGRGGGAVVDARAHRDSMGLPVLPGRHLKGLLRDALERAETWNWPGHAGLAVSLFGHRTERLPPGQMPESGCLRVSDARLPDPVADWLASTDEGRARLPGLFRSLHATAVDEVGCTARDGSLRGIEVVVPFTLEASIARTGQRLPPVDWADRLRDVLPLVNAVGAHRTRGLGRAVLTLESTT